METAGFATAFRRFVAKLAAWSIAIVAIGVAGWLWFSLSYVYSSGERAGYVQKFSKKGWVIKTWEGDLAMVNLPGQLSERFAFTVRGDEVAKKISETMGQRVVIKYNQHRFLPGRIFGDTEYFVTEVHQEPDGSQPAAAPRPAGQTNEGSI